MQALTVEDPVPPAPTGWSTVQVSVPDTVPAGTLGENDNAASVAWQEAPDALVDVIGSFKKGP